MVNSIDINARTIDEAKANEIVIWPSLENINTKTGQPSHHADSRRSFAMTFDYEAPISSRPCALEFHPAR